MRTILVTGAAGFIGSNFVRMILSRKDGGDAKLVAFDKLTYAGNLANLQDLLDAHRKRLAFVKGDIADAQAILSARDREHPPLAAAKDLF
jgi:dTDP-glucose 4,6-dehydratase